MPDSLVSEKIISTSLPLREMSKRTQGNDLSVAMVKARQLVVIVLQIVASTLNNLDSSRLLLGIDYSMLNKNYIYSILFEQLRSANNNNETVF